MKKTLALLLAAMMLLSMAVACGNQSPAETPTTPAPTTPAPTTPAPTTPAPTTPAEPKIVNLSTGEATSAYQLVGNSGADQDIQGLIVGRWYGILPIDGQAVLGPILAAEKPIDVNGDGLTWNIKINPEAKWENGDPINADTFMYTMKMGLDPKLVLPKGSSIADSYIEVVNAEAYYGQGTEGAPAVAWEDVGFKKIDEYTVQVTVTYQVDADLVMRHFGLRTSPIYQPLFEECLSADGTTTSYGTTADKIIGAGPFTLTEWDFGASCKFEKNENYIYADLVKLDGINFRVVEDSNTQLQMFESGEVDKVELTADGLKQYGDDPRVIPVSSFYTCTIDFCDTNTDEPILANENFKKALFYGTDRATIAKVSNNEVALGFVSPPCIAESETGASFRELAAQAGYEPDNYGYDPELAKQYFDKAMQEENLTSVEISLLCASESARHEVLSSYVQEGWQNLFGADRFKLVIDAQPNKNQLELKKSCTTNPNAFELTISDWAVSAGEYDPIRSLAVYTSTYSGKNAPYHNDELDALYNEADLPENRLNYDVRNQKAMEIEKLMIDQALSIPVWYRATNHIVSDRIILPLGDYSSALGWAPAYWDIAE